MENQPLQPKSVKKTYRIITTFELDVPDENYMLVKHEREGLSNDLIGYSLSCQRLTVYSSVHPKIGRFARKPKNIKCIFERCDENPDYSI
jgi:hypothetical protein